MPPLKAVAQRRVDGLRKLAEGYEILRRPRGGGLPGPADALMGKPLVRHADGRVEQFPGYFVRRETFADWRERKYIERVGRRLPGGWWLWRITVKGRQATEAHGAK